MRFGQTSIISGLLLSCSWFGWAENLSEYQIKAGFLFNFITFTQWPESVGERLNLCIYGDDLFGDSLKDLNDKPVGQRRIKVIYYLNTLQITDCHVVFVSAKNSEQWPQLRPTLVGKSILTVSDRSDAIDQGVLISLFSTENKISFVINLKASQRNHLVISARLLRLAKKVIQ